MAVLRFQEEFKTVSFPSWKIVHGGDVADKLPHVFVAVRPLSTLA